MPEKKKKESPLELSETVDISMLKDLLKKAGCTLPTKFDIELEKHLRILMARYIPREIKDSFTSTAQMSKAMRSLFSGDIYSLHGEERLMAEDKHAIRIWDQQFFNKIKGVKAAMPAHLMDHWVRLAFARKKPAFTIDKREITDLIPKTIRHRKGHHKYVMFSFGRKQATINSSTNANGLQSEVSVLSDAIAVNLLPVKDTLVNIRLIGRRGKRNLLLSGSQFEIFFK